MSNNDFAMEEPKTDREWRQYIRVEIRQLIRDTENISSHLTEALRKLSSEFESLRSEIVTGSEFQRIHSELSGNIRENSARIRTLEDEKILAQNKNSNQDATITALSERLINVESDFKAEIAKLENENRLQEERITSLVTENEKNKARFSTFRWTATIFWTVFLVFLAYVVSPIAKVAWKSIDQKKARKVEKSDKAKVRIKKVKKK